MLAGTSIRLSKAYQNLECAVLDILATLTSVISISSGSFLKVGLMFSIFSSFLTTHCPTEVLASSLQGFLSSFISSSCSEVSQDKNTATLRHTYNRSIKTIHISYRKRLKFYAVWHKDFDHLFAVGGRHGVRGIEGRVAGVCALLSFEHGGRHEWFFDGSHSVFPVLQSLALSVRVAHSNISLATLSCKSQVRHLHCKTTLTYCATYSMYCKTTIYTS